MRGSTWRKYQPYIALNGCHVGRRKFEHGDVAARRSDARHLGQAAIGVGHVAQAERHAHDLKRIARHRQRLGIGLDECDPRVGARLAPPSAGRSPAFRGRNRRPRSASCRRPRGRTPAPSRPCRCTHRESAAVPRGGTQPHRPPPPIVIDAQRQQVIQKIVPPGNLAEHLANTIGRLVNGHEAKILTTECTEDTEMHRFSSDAMRIWSRESLASQCDYSQSNSFDTIATATEHSMHDRNLASTICRSTSPRKSWPAARSS